MVTFSELEATAPAVAAPIRERLAAAGLALLGTIRKDGSPRISPVEVSFQEGGLYFGSMPQALKARDLQRDPRFVLLTAIADKEDIAGEGKLFGQAVEITDPAEMMRLLSKALEGVEGAADMTVDDFAGSQMFELRISAASWQKVIDDDFTTTSWREGAPVRYRRRSGPSGLPEDVADASAFGTRTP